MYKDFLWSINSDSLWPTGCLFWLITAYGTTWQRRSYNPLPAWLIHPTWHEWNADQVACFPGQKLDQKSIVSSHMFHVSVQWFICLKENCCRKQRVRIFLLSFFTRGGMMDHVRNVYVCMLQLSFTAFIWYWVLRVTRSNRVLTWANGLCRSTWTNIWR